MREGVCVCYYEVFIFSYPAIALSTGAYWIGTIVVDVCETETCIFSFSFFSLSLSLSLSLCRILHSPYLLLQHKEQNFWIVG
jgi:hypothetical protein